ncbi:ABC transporter B family member 26, chloroplastic isoform X7 [Vitis vinifera]|uniref:ABC transporter B family member 26, chloroplastic isoform X7 n=1 Tax=Vitis vinifera TaxID=29760 RepID=UPI0028834632|nr:ABC transporter B family member 26, chloroplastic isoform X7 [Vitis vinifera]
MAASQLAFRPLSKPHFPLRRTLSSTITFSSTRFRCSCLPKTGQINVEIPVVLRNIRSVLPGGSWWKLSEYEEEAKAREVMPTLRRIWVLVEDERWVIFVAVGSLTLAALSEISMPNLIAASVFSAQSGETMVFYRNSQLLILLCILSGICSGLRSGCFAIANITLVKRLRETLCSAILFQVCVYLATIFVMLSTMHTPQDIDFFETEAVGDLTSRLGADCQQLSNIIGNDINMILRNFLQGAGALIHLLTLSWPLALSTIVICSVLSAIFLVYGQYKQWLDKLAFVSIRESVAYGFWGLSFNTLYRSTQVIAVLLGGMSILTGHVTPEQLTKYILYCEWLIYGTLRLGDNFASLLQSVGASGKVFQLMDLLPSDQFKSEGVKLKRLMGHIEFANVSFYYPSRVMVPVLEHVNISVQANEVVAIVGISGSGKSSLVNLLLRLYEPTTGQILIDGFPLRELDIGWLRGKIGFVGQEPHLFHMDVKSNIRYGCSRDIGQEDIEWAAKLAYAHGFISSLPDGYDTIIDDHLLSGGQKQRIAIARAILRGPAILILDEATSALDAESEHYVEGVLHAFRNDANAKRTVIVIAHRLSTVKAADRIVVMDGGSVIEVSSVFPLFFVCSRHHFNHHFLEFGLASMYIYIFFFLCGTDRFNDAKKTELVTNT